MKPFGYYKIFAVSPKLYIGHVQKNVEEHIKVIESLSGKSGIILFPELSLTGYTCEDLFHTESLINKTKDGLAQLVNYSKNIDSIVIVGLPFEDRGRLYNTACVIQKGKILALVPKSFLPNYKEFYEKRWFTEGREVTGSVEVLGQNVPFTAHQIIKTNTLTFGIEICEDLWAPEAPSTKLALAGAQLILNLSASNELVGKNNYRKDLIKMTSAKLNCGYLYASSGPWESSKDLVFGGHCVYAEDGSIVSETKRLQFDTQVLEIEIDTNKINFERRKNTTFGASSLPKYSCVEALPLNQTQDIKRNINPNPFVPQGKVELEERVQEILEIQSTGLARRMLAIPNSKLVLGLSGGLDSTLALLVCLKACEKLGSGPDRIHCVSMPGFGSSERTKNQARDLAEAFKVSFKEIDITLATTQHLKDIDHTSIDFVYENAQARERTQILFDYANKVGGFVVSTGDLSEYFCGWATFNGDSMGNYGVNASVPKTLVKFLIKYYPTSEENKAILQRVYETPISPELLPLDNKGNIQQSTEDILGPYELIDFYIFHYLRNGFAQDKIVFLAKKAFNGKYEEEFIKKVFDGTYKRFRVNQFKRTTIPPGVKLGISISSRGDLRMPDENEGEGNE